MGVKTRNKKRGNDTNVVGGASEILFLRFSVVMVMIVSRGLPNRCGMKTNDSLLRLKVGRGL